MIQVIISWLWRHSHINWALADQAMVSGVNFFTNILLARYLGLQEFGVFTLVWMAVLFVNSLQMAAIISPMMTISPKQSEKEVSSYFGAVLIQQVAFAGLSFVLLIVGVKVSGIFFPHWQVQYLAVPLATVAFVFQMQDFLRRYFFVRGRASTAFVNDAISYLGQIVILIWLFQITKLDSSEVLWVITGTSAVALGIGMFCLERITWNWAILYRVNRRHWHFSKWLIGSVLIQWMSGNLFIVTAGSLMGAAVVGALKAAQSIIAITHILFNSLENIVPVQASRCYRSGGGKALVAYLRKATWAGGTVTAIIAFLASTFPEFWFRLFYGNQFVSFGDILRWYAVIYLLIFLGLPMKVALRTIEDNRSLFVADILATIFSIVMVFPLVQFLGVKGTLLGILVASVIRSSYLWYSIYRRLLR